MKSLSIHRVLSVSVLLSLLFAATSSAQESAPRPNILFAIADDASFPHMSAYGSQWVKTPVFDRIARQGLLFANAYTPNAKCAPSRACILTGRNSWQLEQAANHVPFFPAKFRTYVEALGSKGYVTGKTAKGWAPGVAVDAAGKRRELTGRPFEKRKARPPAKHISNNDYSENFKDFLDSNADGKPWCFWYGALEPHRAYEYGAGVSKGGKRPSDVDRVPGFWPDNEIVRNDMLDYAFEIEHFDRHLGRMLKELEARGQLENTLVVVTADNGMPFPRIKGQGYELSNHLPLAVMWKRGIAHPGRIIRDYVSFIDFAPTFLEVAGVSPKASEMMAITGKSLTPIFASDRSTVDATRDHVLIGKERHDVGRPQDQGYPIRGIVKKGMLYVRNFETARWPSGNPETGYLNCDGSPTKTEVLGLRESATDSLLWQLCFGRRPSEELYDLISDPDCLRNLAASGFRASIKKELREQLEAELLAQDDPRMKGQGAVFDNYIYADRNTRGFYERYQAGEKVRAGWVSDSDFDKRNIEGSTKE